MVVGKGVALPLWRNANKSNDGTFAIFTHDQVTPVSDRQVVGILNKIRIIRFEEEFKRAGLL